MASNVPYGEQQLPACVRSFSGRSGVKMTLFGRLGTVLGRLRGAYAVTLNDRRFLPLLLDAYGEVFYAKSAGGSR